MSVRCWWVDGVKLLVLTAVVVLCCPRSSAFGQACAHGVIATSQASGDWKAPTTWDIPGYPDNDGGQAGYCVVINTGHTVTLDGDEVSIDGLEIAEEGGLRIGSAISGTLIVESGGGIVTRGTIEMARDSRITAFGGTGVTINEGGKYIPDRVITELNTAVLATNQVEMTWTWPGEDQMLLADQMQVLVSGDFVMNGQDWNDCPDCTCEVPPSGRTGLDRGGKTPPILRGLTQSRAKQLVDGTGPIPLVDINGSLRLICAARIELLCRSAEIRLAGDFDNRSRFPRFFHWEAGQLVLDGSGPQTFEVGGFDLASTVEGFYTVDNLPPYDLFPHTNFSEGTVQIAGTGRTVTFTNQYANAYQAGPCNEALYVDQFDLEPGASIHLDNVNIYRNWFRGSATDVGTDGCAGFFDVDTPDIPGRCGHLIPTVSQWGLSALTLLLVIAGSILVLRRRVPAAA